MNNCPRDDRRGLAGFVRSPEYHVAFRVAVAAVLLPFWLTSEIRQTLHWHVVTRATLIAALWLFCLVVVAVAAPPPEVAPPAPTGMARAVEEPTSTPAPSVDPTPTPNAEPPGTPPAALPEPDGPTPSLAIALDLLERLRVEPEGPRAGYDRALFRHWLDEDGDGCDTRREVLMAESLTPVGGCSLSGGSWRSEYDGRTTTDASTFDIDHFVPLAEAWDSGASAWASSRRDAFANDLGYDGSLIAVSASSNRSKSDRDPAEWKPPLQSYWCTYATTWVSVKLRWQLTADRGEFDALRSMMGSCGSAAPQPTVAPAPPPVVPQPTAPPPTQAPSSGGCHPSYPDFCIPPPPPDLNCPDMDRKNFTVRHDVPDPDPHGFDRDRDGIGCES